MIKLQYVLIVSWIVAVAGCGGGSGGDGANDVPSAEARTGSFIDASVQGLTYETASRSGVTDSDGGYRYSPGESVRFSFGGVYLGDARGQRVLTPLDLYPDQPAYQRALMSFLQSLDSDSDPSNGIELSQRTADQLRDIVREEPAADTFPELLARDDYASLAGRLTNRTSWLDQQDAYNRFEAEIAPLIESGAYRRPTSNDVVASVCGQQPVLDLVTVVGGPFNDCGFTTSTRIPNPTAVRHGFGGSRPGDPDGMNNQTVCVIAGWDSDMEWAFPDLPDVPIHAVDQIYYNTSTSFGVITFTGQRVVWRDVDGGRSAGYVCGTGARNIDFNETCVCP